MFWPSVPANQATFTGQSLVDGDANGGIPGMDMLLTDKLHFTDRTVHITGIGNNEINDKRIER